MPDRAAVIGKVYPPTLYAVGREKIREFALATGETNALHLDLDAARAAGYRDLVAPPMFAVVYCGPAMGPPLFDPATPVARCGGPDVDCPDQPSHGLPDLLRHGIWQL